MNQTTQGSIITEYIGKKLKLDHFESLKLVLSAITFFFVIGAYSILRSFKTSIFLAFVGATYEPYSKIISILITIPTMLFYAKIIDKLKKHQAVYFFIGIYVVLTLLFAYLFAHPVYGIPNTVTSPTRLLGWAFEIFMDLFQALIVGTFWSFLTAISTPSFAGKSYGFIVAGSRVGGILTTFVSWLMLEKTVIPATISISFLTGLTAVFLIGALYCIYLIKKKIPVSHLHGYEAAYTAEKQDEKAHHETGIFEGLRLVLAEPYVFGIFGLVFSFEIINIIFDYQMHVLMAIEAKNQVGAMSSFMLLYTCTFQLLGLVFATFGASTLINRIGVRNCLLVMPVTSVILALLPIFYPKLITLFIVMVVLRALNYGFNQPVREILFIPTVKDIKFKSKAWIESFGRTLSKTTGSTFNLFAAHAPYMAIVLQSGLSIVIATVWATIAILVGKKYISTVASDTVIGKRRRS